MTYCAYIRFWVVLVMMMDRMVIWTQIEPYWATRLFPEDQLLVMDHVIHGCCTSAACNMLHRAPEQMFNLSVIELQISFSRKREKVWLTVQRLKALADWMKILYVTGVAHMACLFPDVLKFECFYYVEGHFLAFIYVSADANLTFVIHLT